MHQDGHVRGLCPAAGGVARHRGGAAPEHRAARRPVQGVRPLPPHARRRGVRAARDDGQAAGLRRPRHPRARCGGRRRHGAAWWRGTRGRRDRRAGARAPPHVPAARGGRQPGAQPARATAAPAAVRARVPEPA
eukprot:168655-Chlamydomonas_euryale.AAC.8